jgi:hypothetical protein
MTEGMLRQFRPRLLLPPIPPSVELFLCGHIIHYLYNNNAFRRTTLLNFATQKLTSDQDLLPKKECPLYALTLASLRVRC